jgi:hypothetical protein
MKWVISLLIAVISLIGISASEAIIVKQVGATGQCDTALSGCFSIPLVPTTLCTVSCAVEISPSFTVATRFWGSTRAVGTCRESINGGVTWAACASQPFTTGNREFYAEASDGSVIAVGTPTGPNTCTIRRSTNLGVNWTTVFSVVQQCTSGVNEGQRLFCLNDGICEFLGSDGSSAQVFRSSDNGVNWTAGETAVAANCGIVGATWNGSLGIMPSQTPGCGGGGIARTYVASGDAWAQSSTWNGTQGDCWGKLILNSVPYAVCQGSGATPDGRYTLRTSAGVNFLSMTLPNALITGIDNGGVAIAPFANTIYIMAQTNTATMGTWVSRDSGVTFTQLTSFGGGGAGVRGGDAFFANGCVYFSVGLTSMFGKIC